MQSERPRGASSRVIMWPCMVLSLPIIEESTTAPRREEKLGFARAFPTRLVGGLTTTSILYVAQDEGYIRHE